MRLLNGKSLRLEEYLGGAIPPYAILSHTWTHDEVSFSDMIEGTARVKRGYQKIQFCREQAAKDGFNYFWVDTCCIDKTNSSELTEAINSIYDWYAQAEICYVYLADVSDETHVDSQIGWHSSFQRSRWFTRGWTLQELIAPSAVVFYSHTWIYLGNKSSLQGLIHETTGIPTEVLSHLKRPNEYSVSERMRWASNRMTTRIEDQAYCLMGLFGINMPLLYGEGDRAFQRLQKEIMSLTDEISGLRLLNVKTYPLVIETFASQDQPEYAILSHTWNAEEVSYQDILLGRGPSRKGYYKIENCCRQVAERGLKYLWVDTCCIDKKSSAELQEAICSMYKWYKNAKICYVYLEDYELSSTQISQLSACRWFKRGWTLQELIAPSSIEFFDSKWHKVGTKVTLRQQIANITKIDPHVLDGEDPAKRTIFERMSWASGRSTTRVEDISYSLMGIFDVFLPMLYGEGDRAFVRLQEEIMKRSEDYTIFAWKSSGSGSSQRGLFARSPSEFTERLQAFSKTTPSLYAISQYTRPSHQTYSPAAMTSRGLLITLPLLREDALSSSVVSNTAIGRISRSNRSLFPFSLFRRSELKSGTYLACICSIESGKGIESQILCIWLWKHAESGMFTRISPETVTILSGKRARKFKMHTIYARPFGIVDVDE